MSESLQLYPNLFNPRNFTLEKDLRNAVNVGKWAQPCLAPGKFTPQKGLISVVNVEKLSTEAPKLQTSPAWMISYQRKAAFFFKF